MFFVVLFLSSCKPTKRLPNIEKDRLKHQKTLINVNDWSKYGDKLMQLVEIDHQSNTAIFPAGNGDIVWEVLKKGSLVYAFSLDKPELNRLTLRFPPKMYPACTLLITETSFLKLPEDRPTHAILNLSKMELDEIGIIQSLHYQLMQHGKLILANEIKSNERTSKLKAFYKQVEDNGYHLVNSSKFGEIEIQVYEAQNR